MPEQHWHPFFLSKTRGAGHKRWRLWCTSAKHQTDMPVSRSWHSLTAQVMFEIWLAIQKKRPEGDSIAVIRDLFPKRHQRARWEPFLLGMAAFQLQEAARGQ